MKPSFSGLPIPRKTQMRTSRCRATWAGHFVDWDNDRAMKCSEMRYRLSLCQHWEVPSQHGSSISGCFSKGSESRVLQPWKPTVGHKLQSIPNCMSHRLPMSSKTAILLHRWEADERQRSETVLGADVEVIEPMRDGKIIKLSHFEQRQLVARLNTLSLSRG